MNRRQVIKQLAIGTTAAILLPSCLADPKKVSIALNNLDVNGDDERLIAELAEVLIPETESPGAKTVNAHHFALVMVDDCQPDSVKSKFVSGLRAFEETTRNTDGKTFLDADKLQRLEMLKNIERSLEDLPENVRTFYRLARRYIVQGYTSSSYFLTEVKPFKLIPGPVFNGCVPVSDTSI